MAGAAASADGEGTFDNFTGFQDSLFGYVHRMQCHAI